MRVPVALILRFVRVCGAQLREGLTRDVGSGDIGSAVRKNRRARCLRRSPMGQFQNRLQFAERTEPRGR